jgi:hypothetical protein
VPGECLTAEANASGSFSCSGHGSCYATGATGGDADCRCDVGWAGTACERQHELLTQQYGAQCNLACHNSGFVHSR